MKINETVKDYSLSTIEGSEYLNISRNDSICDEFISKDLILSSKWFQATIYFLYFTIFIVALIGNGLVCYVVCSSPRMHTVTNYFIVNLAISDILISVFCIPTTFVSILILQYWSFGWTLCPIVNYSQAVSVLVSAYTLIAISIDRYIAIMWPFKPRMSKKQATFLILGVWLLALTVSFPIAVVSELVQPVNGTDRYVQCNRFICKENWTSERNRYYYTISLLVVQYLVPLMVLLFTYTSIAIIVWGKRPPGEAENTRDQRMARSKRKMVKMMITVVLVFTMCWLPFNVFHIALDFDKSLYNWSGLPFVWAALHWLSMSHSCYNPVIYCWMNVRFRTGFIAAFGRLPYLRKFVFNRGNHRYNTSVVGMPMTDLEGSGQFVLQRKNTCTTYVSVRHKTNGSQGIPARNTTLQTTNLCERTSYNLNKS
ncbi:PREDICTED: neuropeptide Y receptor isoform X1 [Polistes canadensis]|uniref:neuropeptide Y receptor isoform X1 n=1 Tax=Polistes canadensis TaxID=91411 RepID=UPI000718C388|nr:PREDICTED: neuropeptide Y receptor isoform X1 [Polistes canadensis]XP_014599241.1 PREDICTED: neuropeptide Y receptor isoform X1 [Polistes canadensis]XP_014599243.1 PREDICTED: neuropeptide Y receptor isoform X1 [Polistes canadensis]XP_014599244.1 PREDICTED: neuropeptide Y receptor isoform X1 [Polistes canadensis]